MVGTSTSTGGVLYTTDNGGLNWQRVAATPFNKGVVFSSNSTGWATQVSSSKEELFKTLDGGKTWSLVPFASSSGMTVAWLGTPRFFSSQQGVVPTVLSNGHVAVFITSDGGQSWRDELDPRLQVAPSIAWFNPPVFHATTSTVWSVGMTVTDNAGRTWSSVKPPTTYTATYASAGLIMANKSVGWLNARRAACVPGSSTQPCPSSLLLLRTANGGHTWKILREPGSLSRR